MQELAETVAPFGPAQSTATVVADAQRGRGRLGEILVSEGLISAADLERALAEQRRSGKLLGRVFLDMALVAHADLLTALAKQQGIGAGTQVVGAVVDASARDREARAATTFAPAPASRAAERRLPRLWLWVAVAVGLLVGIALAVLAGSALRH
jgi:hypothetical protein